MTIEDRRGAAYHEAGHVVVAWSLGVEVGAAAIGINGDDAKGASEIGSAGELPLVDRIALCAAGLVSQNVFRAPTHERVAAMDEARIIELTKNYDEETRLAWREKGYRRAHDLIKAHAARADQLAKKLLATGSLTQTEVRAYLELL
jgi:butyrate kinase